MAVSNEQLQTENINISKNQNSIIDAIQPLFLLSILTGTRKVRFENRKATEVGTFEKIYSITFMIVLLSVFVYFGQSRFFVLKDVSLNYAITDLFSLLSLSITCCNAILLSTFFSFDCIKDFFENLKTIDEILSFSVDNRLKIKIVSILTGHLIFITLETFLNIKAWGTSTYLTIWFISYLIIDWTNFELMIYLYFLEKRVAQLESYLILYRDDKIQKSLMRLMGNNMKTNQTHLKNKLSKKRILELMVVYDKISDNAHILNVTFGSSILLSSLVCFVNAISSIITYLQLNYDEVNNVFVIACMIEWWARCLLSIYYGVYLSEKFTGKCEQITLTLNKNLFAMKNDADSSFRKMIEKFSLLTSTRLVHITACNFFNYDYTFFVSMCGALASYAVILMQSSNEIRSLAIEIDKP